MKAQKLYDLREETEFCSGNDLHEFFFQQTSDPSPSGYVEIDDDAAIKFVDNCADVMAWNSPSLAEHCTQVKEKARG